eukprot:CAMPEP_0170541652 /NCGR_PEP_ID=MMETSP0211-20121228/1334_1 /TAXON_ID=311385 /ORGANISM="Pseudokeronopsis sp., Strain OXSARD2" /LENGTH=90 /DNA_ID=CAMNT_0010844473 /DNA_START=264 /DNA_END=536 /DNA_ORIENTATION=-
MSGVPGLRVFEYEAKHARYQRILFVWGRHWDVADYVDDRNWFYEDEARAQGLMFKELKLDVHVYELIDEDPEEEGNEEGENTPEEKLLLI